MSTNREHTAPGIHFTDISAHGPRRPRFRMQRIRGIVTELHRRHRLVTASRDNGVNAKVGYGIAGWERDNGTIE
jgi:hypothetical protein